MDVWVIRFAAEVWQNLWSVWSGIFCVGAGAGVLHSCRCTDSLRLILPLIQFERHLRMVPIDTSWKSLAWGLLIVVLFDSAVHAWYPHLHHSLVGRVINESALFLTVGMVAGSR